MVAPVTGPFAVISQVAGVSYRSQSIWKQAKPIDQPLRYIAEFATMRRQVGDNGNLMPISSCSTFPGGMPSGMTNDLVSKAYDALKGSVSGHADVGVFLGEFGQAVGMVGNRAGQIAGVIKDLRKLDFVSAARRLNLSAVPKGVSKKKALASNWLEFSFGWSPLIKDIYSAIDVLQNPIKSIRPTGSATSNLFHEDTQGSLPNWQVTGYSKRRYEWLYSVKMGAEVTVTNHNLFLANNLGLVNPGIVVWELIPFSFVVDWFINVQQFLSQGTDFVGLSVSNGWTTFFDRGTVYQHERNPFWAIPINERWATGGKLRRNQGISTPGLFVRPWGVPGWRRAANAVGVVVQGLSR